MIDPIPQYIGKWGRAFIKKDGTPATPDEVTDEFNRVKAMQDKKGAHLNFQADAKLFLPNRAIKPAVLAILREKENALNEGWRKEFYAQFATFPPDAQMGVLSTSYGPFGNKTSGEIAFNQACKALDWAAAAASGRWAGWRAEKIVGHKLMFTNAQAAKDSGDTNPQPAFPGMLTASGFEVDDQVKPLGQNAWRAGG
jgi:hypothetical protein